MRFLLASSLALALGALVSTSPAEAASITGSWSGGGTVHLTSGHVETVRCRVSYEKSTGRTFLLHATCATTAGTFKQSGRIVKLSGTRYSGRLYSDQYDVSGDVKISVNGRRQTVSVSSPKGSGRLSLSKR